MVRLRPIPTLCLRLRWYRDKVIISLVLGAALAASGLAYGFGIGDPNVTRWIVVYVGACGILAIAGYRLARGSLVLNWPVIWAAVFIGYAITSLAWSPDWREGAINIPSFVAVFFVFWAVAFADERDLFVVPIALTGALIWVMVLLFAKPEILGGFGNENFAAEYILIAAPLAFAGHKYVRIVAILSVVTALSWLMWDYHTKLPVWVLLGGLFALVAYVVKRFSVSSALILVLLFFVSLLMTGYLQIHDTIRSLTVRAEVWLNSVFVWLENPIFGVGLGGYNFYYPKYQEHHLQYFPEWKTVLSRITDFAGATHSEPLQLLVVFGFPGVLITALFLLSLANRPKTKLQWAGLCSLAITGWLSLIGFPLQNPSTLIVAAIGAGLVAREARRFSFRPQFPLRLVGSAALIIPIVFAAVALPGYYKAERAYSITRMLLTADPLKAFAANIQAYRHSPWNVTYRRQLVLTLGVLVVKRPNTRLEANAADKAYNIGRTTSHWNPAIRLSRVQYLLNSGRWTESDEVEKLIDGLTSQSTIQGGTWVALAWYGIFSKNAGRVLEAFRGAQSATLSKFHIDQLVKINKMLITEKSK